MRIGPRSRKNLRELRLHAGGHIPKAATELNRNPCCFRAHGFRRRSDPSHEERDSVSPHSVACEGCCIKVSSGKLDNRGKSAREWPGGALTGRPSWIDQRCLAGLL